MRCQACAVEDMDWLVVSIIIPTREEDMQHGAYAAGYDG